jgi:hypothetical protein
LPPQFNVKVGTVAKTAAGKAAFEEEASAKAECAETEREVGGGGIVITGNGKSGPSLMESAPLTEKPSGREIRIFQTSSGNLQTQVAEAGEVKAFAICTPTPTEGVKFEEIATTAKLEVKPE